MSEPNRAAADRNLLFGILALQMDFISRDALIRAMNAWVLEKSKPLGEILVEQGAIAADARALLEPLVQKHVQMHDNDPQKSLAAISSIGSARRELERIADADVQASLVQVSCLRPASQDPWATQPPAVGTSTSSGLRFRVLRPHAEGGLGQVSVALDEELRREVALKEIQNKYADDRDSRARFLLEAEVTGGLEHPGIVPVYGLGSYPDGRPFYAMRFVKGDSLQEAIAHFHKAEGTKRDPRERALALRKLLGRFIDVCDAISYAHSRGVLHRDLKPGNVMLGPYGETLVVDWGLAKPMGTRTPNENKTVAERPLQPALSDSATPTQAGRALGTPSYMPPEQAAGRLDELGPTSDVYSLGATLYCVLTGKPPFGGGDVGEILRRVERGHFPRPREVGREVPAALQAVCLKAMALRPTDRYSSPRALAADVERWLADEPVSAWREPWLVRASRWARQHRALVTSTTVAMLALLLSAIPAFLLIMASRDDALRSEQKALKLATEKGELAEEKGRLAEANEELAEKRLSSAARSLVRPLVFQIQPGRSLPPLSDPEVEVLWDLGSTTDEKLRLRFLGEAIQGPMTVRQLRCRAEFALHAAVGLNPRRRVAAERLLVEHLCVEEVSLEQGADLSLCLVALSDVQPQTKLQVTTVLTRATSETTEPSLWELSRGLATVGSHLEPREAKEAATVITRAMSKTTSHVTLDNLSQTLAAVAARLGPVEAKEAAAELNRVISESTDPATLGALSVGLAAVAGRLGLREAAEVCAPAAAALSQVMSKTSDAYQLGPLSVGLAAVAGRLGLREAAEVCAPAAAALTRAMSKRSGRPGQLTLPRAQAAVAARLGPVEAKEAAEALIRAISQSTDPLPLGVLAHGLSAVVDRLGPVEAKEAAEVITRAMSEASNPFRLAALWVGLAAVAARLVPQEAALTCSPAAAAITRALSEPLELLSCDRLSEGIAAVAAHLGPREAKEVVAALTRTMSKTSQSLILSRLSQTLAAVAARLGHQEAAAACAQAAALLTRAMRQSSNPIDWGTFSPGLAAVAPHLPPQEAVAILTWAMSKIASPQGLSVATNSYALRDLSRSLAAVADRLEPRGAAAVCTPAAATLTAAMNVTTSPLGLTQLAEGLAAVAPHLPSQEAAAILTRAMRNATDPETSAALAKGLAMVVTGESMARRLQRFRSVAGLTGLATSPPPLPLSLAVMAPTLEPLPEPLPTEMLVELLKHPLCVGEARRVVLDALGIRYHRTFADQWDFVRFATEQHLGLDFTSPPNRLELTANAAKP